MQIIFIILIYIIIYIYNTKYKIFFGMHSVRLKLIYV